MGGEGSGRGGAAAVLPDTYATSHPQPVLPKVADLMLDKRFIKVVWVLRVIWLPRGGAREAGGGAREADDKTKHTHCEDAMLYILMLPWQLITYAPTG